MPLALKHQTQAQAVVRIWRRIQAARAAGDMLGFSRLITWLMNRIDAGDITDTEARTAFNAVYGRTLTAAQWNTVKSSRLTAIRTRYQAMMSEADL